ncbi:MAG: transferase [Proteobacteria bacterium]|nr:transferase [Pseudomonadota bacterium]
MKIADFTARLSATPLAAYAGAAPWAVTSKLEEIIAEAIARLPSAYRASGDQAVHERATIEEGATLKGPLIIGPNAYVAKTAYLRGGVFVDENCIVGPGAELKTTIMLRGSKLAHLNFVGDSVLGEGVNIEAGAIIANYRNERADKRVHFTYDGAAIDTGVEKFGAIVGDWARIGANAVIAPGAALASGTIVPRLALVDLG